MGGGQRPSRTSQGRADQGRPLPPIHIRRSDHPVDAASQTLLFSLYTSDLPSLREHLVDHGVAVSPIRHPDYMTSGEISLEDPDGYSTFVGHRTSADHETWLKTVEEKRQRRHHAATPKD